MSMNFQIDFNKHNGSLHVSPKGDFDGSSTCELANLIYEQHDGMALVVIDTRHLGEMCPFGCSTFLSCLHRIGLPSVKLSFQGEKGYDMAPKGSRVLVSPNKHQCRCNGKCTRCLCAEKNN